MSRAEKIWANIKQIQDALRDALDFFKFGRKLIKLKKLLQTESLPGYEHLLIGLDSEATGHRLCYALNQVLSLALGWVPPPTTNQAQVESTPSLFADQNITRQQGASYLYHDYQTQSNVEYFLTDGPRHLLPQLAKPFRSFFVVRYLHPHQPDAYAILQRLGQCELIRSAVDLSEHVPTNLLLP